LQPGEDAEEGRLAAAVASDQPNAVAFVDLERGGVKHPRSPKRTVISAAVMMEGMSVQAGTESDIILMRAQTVAENHAATNW